MKLFVATIETRYEVMAVAETADEAERLASEKAFDFLQGGRLVFDSPEEVIDYFGVNVTEIELGTAKVVD